MKISTSLRSRMRETSSNWLNELWIKVSPIPTSSMNLQRVSPISPILHLHKHRQQPYWQQPFRSQRTVSLSRLSTRSHGTRIQKYGRLHLVPDE